MAMATISCSKEMLFEREPPRESQCKQRRLLRLLVTNHC
jgi:hypothetical protein